MAMKAHPNRDKVELTLSIVEKDESSDTVSSDGSILAILRR